MRPRLSATAAIWVLAALCVVGFAQAILLFPKLAGRSGDGSAGSPPCPTQREVLFLVSDGEPLLVLKPTRDLPEAATLDAGFLDRALFPSGEKHRWYVLQTGAEARKSIALDLRAAPLSLLLAGGSRVSPVALGAEPVAGSGSLTPYLEMELRTMKFGVARPVLDPVECPRILLAFPAEAGVDRVVGAVMGDRQFEVRTAAKDALDDGLTGRGELLKARRP